MATRLQIARARARVALARRTGEPIDDDVVALSKIDLSDAEKPPRAWEKKPADTSVPARPEDERSSIGEVERAVRVQTVKTWSDAFHERLVEKIGPDNDATVRTVEDIVNGAHSVENCVIGPYRFSSGLVVPDDPEHDAFVRRSRGISDLSPVFFTHDEIDFNVGERVGAGIFKKGLHGRLSRFAAPELNIIVVQSDQHSAGRSTSSDSASPGAERSRI